MNISPALAKFLGVKEDTLISRTEVTQAITKYVKEHELQNPANKREMKVDKKMEGIIKLQPGEILSFFNLQRYMKDHYPKPKAAVEALATPVVKEEPPKVAKKVIKKAVKKV